MRWGFPVTIIWGSDGPPAALTLNVEYIAEPEELDNVLTEPTLIPPQYRWLLVWSACVILRMEADEDNTPQLWIRHRDELRRMFHIALSKGRIQTPTGAVIRDEYINTLLPF